MKGAADATVEILTCLGAPADDARVQALLRHFSITRLPEMEDDDLSDEPGSPQDWLPNLSRGIEFGFEDEASFLGAPPVEWGSGPMLLTEVYFYSALSGPAPYEAEFPFGLTHGDDRATVRARMQHSRAPLRSRQRDTWAFKDFDFTVDYAGGAGAFAYAVAIQRPKVPPVDPDVLARCPSVAEFVRVLGRSVSDDLLDTTLARTGYARAFQSVDPTAALSDLRNEMGLELQFGPVAGVAGWRWTGLRCWATGGSALGSGRGICRRACALGRLGRTSSPPPDRTRKRFLKMTSC